MNFVFEQIRSGGDRNLGYLLGDRERGEAALVDPSYSPEEFVERAAAQKLAVRWVINTHGHSDHTNGNDRACALTGARLAAHASAVPRPAHPLADGDILPVGTLEIRVLHVPGHAADHIVLHLARQRVALTGDLLFVGKVGGTGSEAEARAEWDSLQRLMRELPDDTTIWPGHDFGCRPASTIALEKATNPFLQQPTFEAFLRLKEDWAVFKARHGLK